MGFNYKISEVGTTTVLSLEGTLIDKNQAIPLSESVNELISNGKINFVLDMEKLLYMNSSGLNVLVNILTKSRNKGGEVVIAGVSEKVKQLLLITKLNSVFNVTENMEEALEIIGKELESE